MHHCQILGGELRSLAPATAFIFWVPGVSRSFISMMKSSLEVGAGVQRASIITEKTHFPFTQRNRQSCTKEPKGKKEKKESSCHKTSIQHRLRDVSRRSKKVFSIKVAQEHVCLLLPCLPGCCWFLSILLRRAFQLQLIHRVVSEKNVQECHLGLGCGQGRAGVSRSTSV